jgi:hypothetical protein
VFAKHDHTDNPGNESGNEIPNHQITTLVFHLLTAFAAS